MAEGVQAEPAQVQNPPVQIPHAKPQGPQPMAGTGRGTGTGTGTSLLCVLGAGSAVAAPLCMFGMGAQQRGVVLLACFFLNPGVSPVISEILFSAGC